MLFTTYVYDFRNIFNENLRKFDKKNSIHVYSEKCSPEELEINEYSEKMQKTFKYSTWTLYNLNKYELKNLKKF